MKIFYNLVLVLFALAVSACVNTAQVPPIKTAQPADVAAVLSNLAPLYNNVSPSDYVSIGENIINASRCNAYFGQLSAKANTVAQQQSQISLLGAAAGGAIGLAGGPVGAAAGTAMGAGLLNGFLATSSADLGGSPPVATYGLTRQAMQQFQLNSPPPATLAEAAALVELHGETCTPVAAQLLAMQAITTAQTGPLTQPSAPQPTGAVPERTFVPPVIVVTPKQARVDLFPPDQPLPAHRRVRRSVRAYSSPVFDVPRVMPNGHDSGWDDRQKMLKATMTCIRALDGPKC